MKNFFVAVIVLFSSIQRYSACDKAVVRLQEASPAPCTGYLFSPEKELEVRIKIASYDQMENLVKRQEELNNILSKRFDNMQDLNFKLNDKINSQDKQNSYEKFIYFGLGVLVTGFIATNVGK